MLVVVTLGPKSTDIVEVMYGSGVITKISCVPFKVVVVVVVWLANGPSSSPVKDVKRIGEDVLDVLLVLALDRNGAVVRDGLAELFGVARDELGELFRVNRGELEELFGVVKDELEELFGVVKDELEELFGVARGELEELSGAVKD